MTARHMAPKHTLYAYFHLFTFLLFSLSKLSNVFLFSLPRYSLAIKTFLDRCYLQKSQIVIPENTDIEAPLSQKPNWNLSSKKKKNRTKN